MHFSAATHDFGYRLSTDDKYVILQQMYLQSHNLTAKNAVLKLSLTM
jgi:hypothetical protein